MELKRIADKRNVILLLSVVFINMVVFGYKMIPDIRKIYENSHSEQNDKTWEQMRIIKQKKYADEYNGNIQKIIERAQILESNKLFADKDSFSYNNIVKTAKDYKPLLNVRITLDNNTAVEKISEYKVLYLFSFLLIIYIINKLYSERDNGMWQIAYASSGGRFQLVIKRVGIVIFVTFIVSALLYWTTVLFSLTVFDGFKGLSAPIQNLPNFNNCTLIINMWQYLVINYLWMFLAVLMFVSVTFMFMTIFRNRKNVFVGITAFGIVEYLLYVNIENNSIYAMFKYINAVNLINMSDICTSYHNIGFSKLVIGLDKVVLIVLLLLIFISVIVSVLLYTNMKPYVQTTLAEKFMSGFNELYQMVMSKYPVMVKEIHKNIFTAKGIWAVVGVIFAAQYFSLTALMTFSDTEMMTDKMYLSHGGKDYTYIENKINEQVSVFERVSKERQKAKERYDNGQITFEEYYSVITYSQIVSLSMSGMTEPMEKLQYLKRLQTERGINGYMMSDRGYEQIFGKDSIQREVLTGIALLAGIVIICFGSVKLEKLSGMNMLINSSYKGKKRIYCIKYVSCIVVSVLMCITVCVMQYCNLFKYYGMPYLKAPLQSLTFMESISLKVSIIQWILIIIFIKTIITIIVSSVFYNIFNIFYKK
ncbi:MAG: hypothetical protein ACLRLD_02085 [Lachnospira sp.]